jgi:cyclic-di-GMP phosphodiesterase TipF (flagellum assembly factor)
MTDASKWDCGGCIALSLHDHRNLRGGRGTRPDMTERNDRQRRPLLSEVFVVAAMGLVTLAIGTWLSSSVVLSLPLVLLSGAALMLTFLTLHALVRNRVCPLPAGPQHDAPREHAPNAGAAHPAKAQPIPNHAPGHEATARRATTGGIDPSNPAGDEPVHEQWSAPDLRGSLAADDDLVIAPWPAELHTEPMESRERVPASVPARPAAHQPMPPPVPKSSVAPNMAAAGDRGEPAVNPDDLMARSIEALRATQRTMQTAVATPVDGKARSRSETEPAAVDDAVSRYVDARSRADAAAVSASVSASVSPAAVVSEPAMSTADRAAPSEDRPAPDRDEPNTAEPAPSRTRAVRLGPAAHSLSRSVSDGGLQLMLQPIADLGDGSARHLELSAAVELADGRALAGPELRKLAREAGLLSTIDSDKLAAAANVVRRLAARQREGVPVETTVHSGLAGESLVDDDFLDTFAATVVGEAAFTRHLVMAFAQEEVRTFTRAQWGALAVMAEHGFRFSLEAVTDLDMDFERLALAGFAFVKLDAEVFLGGLPVGPEAIVPAADICRHFSSSGFALIVGQIDDERRLAEIMGFGVLLGQGTLFGGPRPLKVANRSSARHVGDGVANDAATGAAA